MRKNLNISTIVLNSLCALAVLFSVTSYALPVVDHVASGDVKISPSGSSIQINQNTDKAVINWSNFNISANEKVHFQQPVNGICLNRVDAANGMSQINGSLSATAKIFLINQAGILFGDSAQVNIGGLVTSTIDVADQNFINGTYHFDQSSGQSGAIINRGVITVADNGLAVLLGSSVSNEGVIQTKASNIILASGNKFTLDFYGNEILQFTVDAPTTASGVDENGNLLANGVSVSGKIINDHGTVYITGRAVQGVFDNLINMSGVIQAKSAAYEDGIIFLNGLEGGAVSVTGELDVSGDKDSDGGNILVLGEEIIIDKKARLNASGDQYSGGGIVIGCPEGVEMDFGVPIAQTKRVYVGSEVILNADAKTSGNGGSIIVWSTSDTTFLGKPSARGGELNGDGGLVLVYSKGDLNYNSATKNNVDVSAPNGNAGDVIFNNDPHAFQIFKELIKE